MLSETAAAMARERLAAMVGPVTLRFPAGDPACAALARTLTQAQPLLTAEPCEGEELSLLDPYGRETGIQFLGAPEGQELGALLDAIAMVSRGSTPLTPLGRAQARDLPGHPELWILTTPA